MNLTEIDWPIGENSETIMCIEDRIAKEGHSERLALLLSDILSGCAEGRHPKVSFIKRRIYRRKLKLPKIKRFSKKRELKEGLIACYTERLEEDERISEEWLSLGIEAIKKE